MISSGYPWYIYILLLELYLTLWWKTKLPLHNFYLTSCLSSKVIKILRYHDKWNNFCIVISGVSAKVKFISTSFINFDLVAETFASALEVWGPLLMQCMCVPGISTRIPLSGAAPFFCARTEADAVNGPMRQWPRLPARIVGQLNVLQYRE